MGLVKNVQLDSLMILTLSLASSIVEPIKDLLMELADVLTVLL